MGSDIRILLVDDFEVNQKIARQHLNKGGYEVDLASNGQQAVEAFTQNRYDLILMDIDMPVMDGYEAAGAIRKIEADRAAAEVPDPATRNHVPIIAMSGNAAAGDDNRPTLPGMDDYICKPFQRAELLELVNKWFVGTQSPNNCNQTGNACQTPNRPQNTLDNPLNIKQALSEFMGNKAVLSEVLQSFVTDSRECIQTAREAMLKGDYARIQSLAHKLGGGAANLTATELAEAAYTLENVAPPDEIDQIQPLIENVEQAFRRFESYLGQNAMLGSTEEEL
jgi:CheY-like chemotaxis protein